jgi:CheY-like chemotaxis protein
MTGQRILIVDDEESVLTVLRDSLGKRSDFRQITTATDGSSALEYLRKDSFDLVITDYRMAGMNGLELLEAVRSIQPKARVILMTAYGSDELEAEAHRRQAYRYLAKPLEIGTFRRVVEEALADIAISRPGILILSDARYREVLHLLESLRGSIGARCVFLADAAGHVIASAGDVEGLSLEQIASLMGGGIATISECGRSCGDEAVSVNLAYHKGENYCLYATNVGERLLMIMVIRNAAYASRIGSVWYYAQQAADAMGHTLGEGDFASPQPDAAPASEGELERQLDGLFPSGEEPEPAEIEAGSMPAEMASAAASHLMTFEDAVRAGILPSRGSSSRAEPSGGGPAEGKADQKQAASGAGR